MRPSYSMQKFIIKILPWTEFCIIASPAATGRYTLRQISLTICKAKLQLWKHWKITNEFWYWASIRRDSEIWFCIVWFKKALKQIDFDCKQSFFIFHKIMTIIGSEKCIFSKVLVFSGTKSFLIEIRGLYSYITSVASRTFGKKLTFLNSKAISFCTKYWIWLYLLKFIGNCFVNCMCYYQFHGKS